MRGKVAKRLRRIAARTGKPGKEFKRLYRSMKTLYVKGSYRNA